MLLSTSYFSSSYAPISVICTIICLAIALSSCSENPVTEVSNATPDEYAKVRKEVKRNKKSDLNDLVKWRSRPVNTDFGITIIDPIIDYTALYEGYGPKADKINKVIEKYADRIIQENGVHGVGLTFDESGDAKLVVLVDNSQYYGNINSPGEKSRLAKNVSKLMDKVDAIQDYDIIVSESQLLADWGGSGGGSGGTTNPVGTAPSQAGDGDGDLGLLSAGELISPGARASNGSRVRGTVGGFFEGKIFGEQPDYIGVTNAHILLPIIEGSNDSGTESGGIYYPDFLTSSNNRRVGYNGFVVSVSENPSYPNYSDSGYFYMNTQQDVNANPSNTRLDAVSNCLLNEDPTSGIVAPFVGQRIKMRTQRGGRAQGEITLLNVTRTFTFASDPGVQAQFRGLVAAGIDREPLGGESGAFVFDNASPGSSSPFVGQIMGGGPRDNPDRPGAIFFYPGESIKATAEAYMGYSGGGNSLRYPGQCFLPIP